MKLLIEENKADIIFTDAFNGLDEKERLKLASDYLTLDKEWSKNIKNINPAFEVHVNAIANEPDRRERLSYLWYLSQLAYPIDESTAELIKEFSDEGRIVFKNDRWLYDPQFYKDENTTTLNNKIKIVTYFNDKSNRNKWKGAEDIMDKFKRSKDGSWKTYAEISKIISAIDKENPSNPTDEMVEAAETLRNLNPKLNKKTSLELIRQIYNSGDDVEKLISKALQSMR